MKKELFGLSLLVALSICACSTGSKVETTVAISEEKVETTAPATEVKIEETKAIETKKAEVKNDSKTIVHKMSEREFSFDPSKEFSYTGNDNYLKAITDDMVGFAKENYGGQGAVEIPTPYVVEIDDSDKNDIKIYGDFYIYGYNMNGTIFNMKNGGSYPGCYHLKDDNGNVSVVNKEFAEDGSNNWSSLVKICGGDETLAKEINNVVDEDGEKTRIDYVKMYANANKLRVSGIKDYGWPIILFSDINDAEFMYNFYNSYFGEITQEDTLNDMADRIERLKEAYFTQELLDKISDLNMDKGADMVINAQDVTEEMLDTLQAEDLGNGNVKVSYDQGGNKSVANVKLEMINGNKMITDISFE